MLDSLLAQLKALAVIAALIFAAGLIGVLIPALANSTFAIFIVLWLAVVLYGTATCLRDRGYWPFA